MDRSSDAAKKGVSCRVIIVVLGIDLIFLILWVIGKCHEINIDIYTFMRDISDLLRNLSTFSAAILGVTVVRKGIFDKEGTKYYTTSYGEKKLGNIIGEYNEHANYFEVVEVISKLLISNSEDPFDCPYYKYVFKLQKTDDNFIKVWNDYNFYSAKEKMKTQEKEYYEKLEKYIFIRIYDEDRKPKKSE